jgi:NADH:ubiquinone oxidoreductase subunit E
VTLPDRDVLLCRGCCCGTNRKHPGTDHAGQQATLEAVAEQPRVRVRVVDCLDECASSNVVLVRDFTAGRRPTDTWLGDVLDAGTTQRLAAWVSDGGPLPEDLAAHEIPRTRSGRLA